MSDRIEGGNQPMDFCLPLSPSIPPSPFLSPFPLSLSPPGADADASLISSSILHSLILLPKRLRTRWLLMTTSRPESMLFVFVTMLISLTKGKILANQLKWKELLKMGFLLIRNEWKLPIWKQNETARWLMSKGRWKVFYLIVLISWLEMEWRHHWNNIIGNEFLNKRRWWRTMGWEFCWLLPLIHIRSSLSSSTPTNSTPQISRNECIVHGVVGLQEYRFINEEEDVEDVKDPFILHSLILLPKRLRTRFLSTHVLRPRHQQSAMVRNLSCLDTLLSALITQVPATLSLFTLNGTMLSRVMPNVSIQVSPPRLSTSCFLSQTTELELSL